MALPLKNGVDLYTNELLRARLHNFDGDLAEHGVGSIYFNTTEKLNTSDRVRYRGKTAWHSVANLEDIEDVKDLIKALSGSSSESVASVLGRVITLEGYFSNGKAKDADLLDGHNSDYFAEAATLNDLLEDYEAFKAVFSDNSDDYINTWTEVKAFLDGIKNTEDLNAILLGINTELGKKADKATTLAGYGITDAVLKQDYINLNDLATVHAQVMGYGNPDGGWKTYSSGILSKVHDSGFALQGGVNALFFRGIGGSVWEDKWHVILHDGNYASELDTRYLQLAGGTIEGGIGALMIKRNSDVDGAYVGYSNNTLILGYLGINSSHDPAFTKDGSVYYTILHENNYSNLITDLNNNLNVKGSIFADYAVSISRSTLVGQLLGGSEDYTYVGRTKSGVWEKDIFKFYANDDNYAYGNFIFEKQINSANGIKIGNAILSWDEEAQSLKISTNVYADGQVSSGGIGSEGSGSGASGIVILEDWEKYDDTLAQVLGAGLGVGLRDKIAALESKATNVSVAQTLTSGKEIGAITIGGVATKLFAPDDYLPLSGGTISGALTIQSGDDGKLIFDNTDTETYWSLIYFKQNGETYGRFGTQGTTELSWNNNLILHSGNFNTFAPTLTGTGASGRWGIGLTAETLTDLNEARHGFLFTITDNYGTTTGNKPHKSHAAGLTWAIAGNSNYRAQLASTSDSRLLYFRHMVNSTWEDWNTLAFTDSDITGNAASATKLQTARSLWGQSFDGTGDVDGKIYQNGKWVFGLHADNNLFIGYDSKATGSTQIFGKSIEFYDKIGGLTMLINSSGNVGIGTTDPLSKLHVKGDLRVSGNYDYLSFSMSDVNATYNAYDAADGWSNHNFLSNGTLMFFISGREIEWSHFATPLWVKKELKVDATAYFNGVTSISSRLLVGGATDSGWVPFQVKGATDIDGPLYISAHSKEGIYFNENGIHWHNTAAGWVSALMEFSSNALMLRQDTTINGDLRVTGNIIADGQVSSGGVAEAGTGGAVGGSGLDRVVFTIPAQTTSFTCEHNLGTREISVTIYEEGNDYQQVLTDVYLDSTNIARIVFGAATDVAHKVVIIG